jgi:hypothetical protein
MSVTVDSRGCIFLSGYAAEGEVYEVRALAPGQLLLARQLDAAGSVRLVRDEGGLLVAVGPRRLTVRDTRRALEEFP